MTDKSISQVALPAGTSVTAPSISGSSVTHQGTRPPLCKASAVEGSVGRGACQFLEHLCPSFYGREGEGTISSLCDAED